SQVLRPHATEWSAYSMERKQSLRNSLGEAATLYRAPADRSRSDSRLHLRLAMCFRLLNPVQQPVTVRGKSLVVLHRDLALEMKQIITNGADLFQFCTRASPVAAKYRLKFCPVVSMRNEGLIVIERHFFQCRGCLVLTSINGSQTASRGCGDVFLGERDVY